MNFIPKRDVTQMLNVGPNLCLADTQAYILAMETLGEKAYRKKRNREAVKVLLMSVSMLIKEWDNKLFVLFEFGNQTATAYAWAYI